MHKRNVLEHGGGRARSGSLQFSISCSHSPGLQKRKKEGGSFVTLKILARVQTEAMASDRREKRRRPETTGEKVIMSAHVWGFKDKEYQTKLQRAGMEQKLSAGAPGRQENRVQGGSVSEGLASKAGGPDFDLPEPM